MGWSAFSVSLLDSGVGAGKFAETRLVLSLSGAGAAVLIRAVDPVSGTERMKTLRAASKKPSDTSTKPKEPREKELSSGPSKLTQALAIDKATFNQKDITTCDVLWLEDCADVDENLIVTSARVGVDYAGEWAAKPLRFYVLGNKSVSVRDKKAEAELGDESAYFYPLFSQIHARARATQANRTR